MMLYPAIDLLDRQCVRLRQGDFAAATFYPDPPLTIAQRYQAAGATWLHLVDLAGARDGTASHLALITALARHTGLQIQTGGGIRTADDVTARFDAGVARVVLGSLAVTQPHAATPLVQHFGPERFTIALDVRFDQHTPRLQIHGWQAHSPEDFFATVAYWRDQGVRQILCTDVARDGMLQGPNLDLYMTCTARFPELLWQASGGVRTMDDLRALRTARVSGVVLGRSLLEGTLSLTEALQC